MPVGITTTRLATVSVFTNISRACGTGRDTVSFRGSLAKNLTRQYVFCLQRSHDIVAAGSAFFTDLCHDVLEIVVL